MARFPQHGTLKYYWLTRQDWLILTPDHDRYEEEMSRGNPDLIDFEHLGPTGNIPPHVRANTFYGFADIAPGELARQMALAQNEADAIRQQRGIPAVAPPPPQPPMPHPAPAVAPGVLVPAPPAAVAPAAAVPRGVHPAVPAQVFVWVAIDQQGQRRREFSAAVPIMVDGSPMGGGLQLDGPATALNIAKSLRGTRT